MTNMIFFEKSKVFFFPHETLCQLNFISLNSIVKGAAKSYFTHYSCVVITLFNTGIFRHFLQFFL